MLPLYRGAVENRRVRLTFSHTFARRPWTQDGPRPPNLPIVVKTCSKSWEWRWPAKWAGHGRGPRYRHSARERLLKTFGETFVSKQWKTNNWIFRCSFRAKKSFLVRLNFAVFSFFFFLYSDRDFYVSRKFEMIQNNLIILNANPIIIFNRLAI